MATTSPKVPLTDKPGVGNWVSKYNALGGKTNWIRRTAEHIKGKGKPESLAIPYAVNSAREVCRTGDTNLPGVQQVNAKSRAEACAAVKQWDEARAKAKAAKDLTGYAVFRAIDLAGPRLARGLDLTDPQREVIDLAFNPSQARGFHGRWVKIMEGLKKLKPGQSKTLHGPSGTTVKRVSNGFKVTTQGHEQHASTPGKAATLTIDALTRASRPRRMARNMSAKSKQTIDLAGPQTPAMQMPYREQAAEQLGPRTFRKQILRTGSIPYQGKTLTFDRAYLERAVESFNAKAFDQVPFVLADSDNKHSAAPERFRGEVKKLEMSGDGIDAIVELTDEGAEIVRKNPRLGVSARLVPDVERDGKTFPVAIEHVCGTLNPRLTGMKPWETISLSVHWPPHTEKRAQVIDLSASEYMDTPTLTDEHLDALKGLEGDARSQKIRELLGEMTTDVKPVVTDAADEDSPKFKDKLKGLLGIGGDEEENFDQALDALLETEPEEDKVVTASLSDTDRQAIDLANSEAKTAREEAQAATARLAEAEWKLERKNLLGAGVPPAMLDLAEPLLKHGPKQVIDLSNGDKLDAGEVIRKLLASAKGSVDLSDALGSGQGSEDADERDEAHKMASDDKAWEASV